MWRVKEVYGQTVKKTGSGEPAEWTAHQARVSVLDLIRRLP
jgi:hypothetical protein